MKILAGATLNAVSEVIKAVAGKPGLDNVLCCCNSGSIWGMSTGKDPDVLGLEEEKERRAGVND